MSVFRLRRARRRATVAVCTVALLVTSIATAADAASDSRSLGSAQGDAAPGAAAAKKKKKKQQKKCKRGYKRVTIKVKRKRGGKRVTVKVKKCRKVRKKKATPSPAPVPGPNPAPGPASGPAPTPAPAGPKVDQILGWSTLAQDPDTPPADLVADGGTITNCTTTNSLSVYIRRSGVTSVGQLNHVWKRDGAVIASGSNGSTYNGAFRYGITINPVNGVYEIVWSSGGTTVGTAKITRSC
ncbi:MAG: hypothetical protein ACRDLQ_12020 [Solirubrobacterales bacterium]